MVFKGKIGVEIECIVKSDKIETVRRIAERKGWEWSGDGSIREYDYATETSIEFKSKPYKVDELDAFFDDVKEIYEYARVNDSCGLHMHLSFENISNYYKLLCWKFVDSFQKSYETEFTSAVEVERKTKSYSKFFNGESDFSAKVRHQLRYGKHDMKPQSRYQCINFNAYNRYGTVEFRIFAAANGITKFKNYVKFLLGNVETFLSNETFEVISIVKKPFKENAEEKVVIKEKISVATLGGN